jgi:hypothetical protein
MSTFAETYIRATVVVIINSMDYSSKMTGALRFQNSDGSEKLYDDLGLS